MNILRLIPSCSAIGTSCVFALFPKLLDNGVVIGGDGLSSADWTVRGADLMHSHDLFASFGGPTEGGLN